MEEQLLLQKSSENLTVNVYSDQREMRDGGKEANVRY